MSSSTDAIADSGPTELSDRGVAIIISDSVPTIQFVLSAIAALGPVMVRLFTSSDAGKEFPDLNKTPVASIEDIFNAIASGPQPTLIVDDARDRSFQRFGVFRKVFLSLADGGAFVSCNFGDEIGAATRAGERDTTAQWLSAFDAPDKSVEATAWASVAKKATGQVTYAGSHVIVRKRGAHLMKIANLIHRPDGENRVERCVSRRSGEGSVTRLRSIPARTWEVRSDFETNDPGWAAPRLRSPLNVRELVARAYRNVTVAPRQVVTSSNLLLPESSMQPLVRPMRNYSLTDAGPDYTIDPGIDHPATPLEGTFFYLDNEFPGHYGHVTSQDLTRLWAWEDALELDADCRLLLSAPKGQRDIHDYQYRLLESYGIRRDQVVVFDRPQRVERLVIASLALQNHYFASPVCKDIWSRVREGILDDSRIDLPRRVFVGRNGGLRRRCLNNTEVETRFKEHGFQVVYPEQLDISDQIRMFSEAEAVAGYAGSGMFTMAYSKNHPTWIVLGSRAYTANTEYMIAGLYDDPIRYMLCEPEIKQPAGGWSADAYFSDFSFDFGRDGDQLDSILTRI